MCGGEVNLHQFAEVELLVFGSSVPAEEKVDFALCYDLRDLRTLSESVRIELRTVGRGIG